MKNLEKIANAIGWYLIKRHDGYLLCRNLYGVGGIQFENLEGVANHLAKHVTKLLTTIGEK